MARKNRVREVLDLHIDSIGFEGKAVARHDDMVCFVEGAVPGDKVQVEVIRKKRRFKEARTIAIHEASPFRVEPRCSHFGECGGCRWQHLDYNEQVRWKGIHVRDAFQRIGKIEIGELLPALPAENQYYYRNKMEFSFGDSRWLTADQIAGGEEFDRSFALGLHVPGRYDKILDVDRCYLQSELSNAILTRVREQALAFDAKPFSTKTHEGFLRNLVVRHAQNAQQTMLILVTSAPESTGDQKLLQWFDRELPGEFPAVTTTIHALNTSKSSVAVGEPRIMHGEGFITETLLGVHFRISPFSFFQTNTRQAERLFSIALEYASPTGDQRIWDLYCGAGSISLCAAQRAAHVTGIELNKTAIEDARANAMRNNINNVTFIADDMKNAAADLLARSERPDTIIVDPPRAGMHPDVVKALPEFGADTIVYVSCNPTTQARDCAILDEHYQIERMQPVDMFPNTYHIESVARLVRRT